MAARKTIQKTEEKPIRYCDNCKIGEWFTVHWNLDYQGKPLTKHCKYGGKGILRGTPACGGRKRKRTPIGVPSFQKPCQKCLKNKHFAREIKMPYLPCNQHFRAILFAYIKKFL